MKRHKKTKKDRVRFRDVGGLAAVFLLSDGILSLLLFFSLGAGAVSAFMLILGVVEIIALVSYFGKAVYDALPKSVQRTLVQS